ncbi:hypothetical protein A3735_07550 [Oleiphilus sp. HI0061]|uniref:hypothetical protein n=1 Tax=Oleiphilus sp. HI0061 TaxID=1822239 RepID=UPI0007D01EA5|nr:hypothetical protein [Oleiphilus sp. HI0061]KZY65919.1 hypothetical protein A3735_07550 [Oleiphilus sp. HI0061]
MVMNFIKTKADQSLRNKAKKLPDWVSEENASLLAWQYIEEQKREKTLYIKTHNKIGDFQQKSSYKIFGSSVAKAAGVARNTLFENDTYSEQLIIYLSDINDKLLQAKDQKLKSSQNTKSRGTIRNSKDELLRINESLKSRVKELENQKTEELVRRAFDELPLPVKKKLGID